MNMLSQILRFLIVGVANTAVGLGTIFMLKWAGGMGDVPANLLGYLVGLCLSFVLNSQWTFRFSGNAGKSALRFGIVFLVSYAVNLLVMIGLRDVWRVDSYLAHALSVAPYTIVFFLGSRYFAFRDPAGRSACLRA